MNDVWQCLILAGGVLTIVGGLPARKILDILIGVCFVSLAALNLSRQTGRVIEVIDIAISVLIFAMAIIKLRVTMQKGKLKKNGEKMK